MKKTIKYTVLGLILLLFSLALVLGYLYSTADMLTPQYVSTSQQQVIKSDSLRQYGENSLRLSESGLWEIKISGNDFQRGEAIGKLSTDLLYYQEKVFVDWITEFIPSQKYLSFLRFCTVIFNRNIGKNIPEEYRNEIYGISLSCTDEYNAIGSPYERQLNYHAAHDIGHAMQDYMLVGCSSFASWGDKSADSTLIIGRNFDFHVGDMFSQNKLVSFYQPENGYKFATIGWAGMIGVLSGMNNQGLTVTINAAKSVMPTSSATPISILTREILQYASTIEEAYEIALKRKTFVAESILIGSAIDGRAAIIEKSPTAIDLFYGKEQQIICTNHYQSESFMTDKRNLENIENSDSYYRFVRMQELLREHPSMDATKAASVLRNYKGQHNEELGLANEMAINQFIAHHSVIFQPEKLLMWVSTSPWQCGKYVAYDLNKIFNDSIDFSKEIYTAELNIAEDEFLQKKEFEQLTIYKALLPTILKSIKQKTTINNDILESFENSNPHFYYTNEILGDYFHSRGEKEKAQSYWQKALSLAIPKKSEKERIQEKIKK